jgi:uncharacterized protein (TIGR02246 family)
VKDREDFERRRMGNDALVLAESSRESSPKHFYKLRYASVRFDALSRRRYAMRMATAALAVVLALASVTARAAEGDDEAAIRLLAEAYVTAYNAHDANALAELWDEDAVYLRPESGESVEGRDAIQEMFAEMFKGADQSKLAVTVKSVRLITPDVAVEDGTADVTDEGGETTTSTYTAIHVKKDDKWRLTSVRETDVPGPASSKSSDLEELGWLVGDWGDSAEGSSNGASVKWDKSHSFLIMTFRMTAPGWEDLEGHQFIGWDPAEGVIRSWMFDTDGGFGGGVWTKEEGRWIVDFDQTLPDGSQGSCTNIYEPVDADHYLWQSVNRVIDGEEYTDTGAMEVARRGAAKADTGGAEGSDGVASAGE